jgi:phage-related protein
MFEIIFYNSCGRVIFGGGRAESRFRIIETDGLGLSGKSYKNCTFENCNGQETVEVHTNARVITLKGDFFMGQNYIDDYKNALSVLDKEGYLELKTGADTVRIKAYCTQFLPLEKKGVYMPFTVQFVCDDPYFESAEGYEVPIYKTIALLDSDFEFPGAFSERITRRNIYINSSAETEPIIIIKSGRNPSGILHIQNHTSGEYIDINYEPLSDEYITVDVKNRRIFNQNGDNLLNYIADDSFFDGFHLYPGDNDIEVHIGTANTELEVMVMYNERFLEAVY